MILCIWLILYANHRTILFLCPQMKAFLHF